MNNIYNTRESPLVGVSIDPPQTRQIDDLFWVHKEGNIYKLQVFMPSISQTDNRVIPDKYLLGFTIGHVIPAICLEFSINILDGYELRVEHFIAYECWAKNMASIKESYVPSLTSNQTEISPRIRKNNRHDIPCKRTSS